MSYSQLNQDIEVLKFYNYKLNGFFIEIGASDGIELSNTYLLEKDYNWKGICVEPIPEKFKLLCNNRPNSICCSDAVYNESNKQVIFDISNSSDLFSGISKNIACHKNIVDSDKTQIIVNTITLNDLLEKYNAPSFIDYLSLDTEGSELEILKSVDYNKYIFGVIDIEHNYLEPFRTSIRELLTSNGYEYIKENQWDDSYMHKSIFSKLIYYYHNDYTKPITIIINKQTNSVKVSSSYWNDDFGTLNNDEITFNILGTGKIHPKCLLFNYDNFWHIDLRK